MTNSGVIIKIEYAIFPSTSFIDLDIIPYSGKFSENFQKTAAGAVFNFSADFSIEKIETATDEMLAALVDRKAAFRLTDGNGTRHICGTGIYPARLAYSREVNNEPGGFNGYRCSIARLSPMPITIETDDELPPESSTSS